MGARIDLMGQKFERLLVIDYAYTDIYNSAVWRCLCDCGNIVEVIGHSLRTGHTRSCGCIHKEQLINRMSKHNHNKKGYTSRTYRSWNHLEGRCYNKKDNQYENYGGRGIKICNRWRGEHGFENFLADMGERPNGKSIDRIDNDGNYEPGNCRWATATEQMDNTRRTRHYCFYGITQTLNQWADKVNIPRNVLQTRIYRWGAIDKVIDFPYVSCKEKNKKNIKV